MHIGLYAVLMFPDQEKTFISEIESNYEIKHYLNGFLSVIPIPSFCVQVSVSGANDMQRLELVPLICEDLHVIDMQALHVYFCGLAEKIHTQTMSGSFLSDVRAKTGGIWFSKFLEKMFPYVKTSDRGGDLRMSL